MVKYKGKKILLVDDAETILHYERMLLEGEGFGLSFAKDGEEALEKVSEDLPDLILLDLLMPGMDGYEVCERLKNDPITANIPIIIITVLSSEESINRCSELGVSKYIFKPINKLEFLENIKTALSDSEEPN